MFEIPPLHPRQADRVSELNRGVRKIGTTEQRRATEGRWTAEVERPSGVSPPVPNACYQGPLFGFTNFSDNLASVSPALEWRAADGENIDQLGSRRQGDDFRRPRSFGQHYHGSRRHCNLCDWADWRGCNELRQIISSVYVARSAVVAAVRIRCSEGGWRAVQRFHAWRR